MRCPACGGPAVVFSVPPVLRAYAPAEAGTAAICARCLRTFAVDADADLDADPDFSTLDPQFPDGEGGVAVALLLGCLDSLALRRGDIEALLDHAERAGVDPLLTLDRLAAGDVDPHFDIERRRPQLLSLLE